MLFRSGGAAVNFMIETGDGNSLGEGFGSCEEAARAAQGKADRLNQVVYVVRADGHPVSPGQMAIEIQPEHR